MTVEQITTFATLMSALVLFAWGRWRYDVVAVAALLVLTLVGIVPVADAFAGFGHPAVITVASVLVIGRAVYRSGVIEAVARRVVRATSHSSGQVLLLTGLVATCSMIMNNVAALTLLMPMAIRSAHAANRPVSQVLMPLAFASLLGGLATLIGTPPNIIIANYRAETIGEPFDVFDFTPVGLSVAVFGIAFISLIGWRLIPQRRQKSIEAEQMFEISDYVSEARVPVGSPLVGQSLRQFAARVKVHLNIVALVRRGRSMLAPDPSVRLLQNDVLILEGNPSSLQEFATNDELKILGDEKISRSSLQSDNVVLVEAVLSPGSWLEDRLASPARFRRMHGANLLAVSRQGRPVWRGLKDLRLRVGDILLLQGYEDSLPDVLAHLQCLPLAERDLIPARTRPDLVPLGLFAAGIAAAGLGLFQVQVAFATTALILVLLNYLPSREIYSSIDWPVIVLVGALLPVGHALEQTGATKLLGQSILHFAVGMPLPVLLAIVIAVSMLLSDVINNAAAAIVMAPFAVTLAQGLGLPADSFLMAVAVGSSCTFLTPIGHQSNTLVMGPGG